jgi:hypothetical protein
MELGQKQRPSAKGDRPMHKQEPGAKAVAQGKTTRQTIHDGFLLFLRSARCSWPLLRSRGQTKQRNSRAKRQGPSSRHGTHIASWNKHNFDSSTLIWGWGSFVGYQSATWTPVAGLILTSVFFGQVGLSKRKGAAAKAKQASRNQGIIFFCKFFLWYFFAP